MCGNSRIRSRNLPDGGMTVNCALSRRSIRGSVKRAVEMALFVSPNQINAQLPYDVREGEAKIRVTTAQGNSTEETVNIGAAAPGIFMIAGGTRAVAINQDFTLNTADNAEARGRVLTIYLAGIGPLDGELPAGQAAPSNTLYRAALDSSATIGGKDSPILFLGLTPGFVGLAQANVQIPADAPVMSTVLPSSSPTRLARTACGRWRRHEAQFRADRQRGPAHFVGERAHAFVVHVLRRARDADRGDDPPAHVAHRRGDATDQVLVFLEVERVAAGDIALHALLPERVIDRERAISLVLVEQLAPVRRSIVERQRLAEAGRGERVAVAHPTLDLDAPAAGDLVEIERALMRPRSILEISSHANRYSSASVCCRNPTPSAISS